MNQANNNDKMTGFRKRQQLTKTNKSIFAWVAGASVVVTVCAVFIQFLVQQLLFNQRVITDKTTAQTIVIQNKTSATALKKKVDELVADTNLSTVKTNEVVSGGSSKLQVILDALPTTNDGATFANSLAKVILPRSGVTVESLEVDSDSETAAITTSTGSVKMLGFTMTIKGTYDQIQRALTDFVRVIRPINVTKLTLQGDGSNLTANITGVTYSLPSSTVNLESKPEKP